MTGRFALIGDPVDRSPSPAMHRAAFAALGEDLDYVAVRVTRRDLLAAFPVLRKAFLGLNVTSPLKEAVLPLLDTVSAEAVEAGSVNTVTFPGGRAEGYSTDGAGFLAALGRAGAGTPRRALVLGTGGAARAVAGALRKIGVSVAIAGRNAEAGARLRRDLGAAAFVPMDPSHLAPAIEETELLANATPVGGEPESGGCPLPEEVELRPGLTVVDLVYRPRRTVLLARAEAAGCILVEGVEMLVEQGAASFSMWTGRPAPVEIMRQAAHAALDEQGRGRAGAATKRGARR
ncbi:MAG TPA: shikimate dehydrogenase [Actinomycetota bacterium]|nr:shikimate dehydrogenase [Actinomycetota bacterium]